MASPPADLLIVARDRPLLYEAFCRMRVGEADIEIVIDRREAAASRRWEARDRRQTEVDEALRVTGWVVVPSSQRMRPAEAAPPSRAPSVAAAPPASRPCYVTLNKADVECLAQGVPRHSNAFHALGAALDLGNGMVSVRCSASVAAELLFVARWNCPNAVEAIRASIEAATDG